MFNFDYKSATVFKAAEQGERPFFKYAKFLKKFLFIFSFILLSLFFYGYLLQEWERRLLRTLEGFGIIFLNFSIIFWLAELFVDLKLKKPLPKKNIEDAAAEPERYNLAEFLSFEAARAVYKSLRLLKSKKVAELNSTILFYFILAGNPYLNFIFSRGILDFNGIKKALKKYCDDYKRGEARESLVYSEDFQNTISEALKVAGERNHQKIETGDIIIVLSVHNPIFRKILIDAGLREDDMKSLARWLESLERVIEENKKFWEWKNLSKKGSICKDWAAGYTPTLDQFSFDWTEIIKKIEIEEVVGHKIAIEQTERILSKQDINNVLIVGEPGTGRKRIIQALALKSFYGRSLPQVNYKRIVELDLSSLAAKVKSLDEAEEILDACFKEVMAAGNVILVIDEFHNFTGKESRPGIIDISGVISPYLRLPNFQLIAITSFTELHKSLELNPSILNLFEKVEVFEISEEDALAILENFAFVLERKYKIFISYPALRDIIKFSAKYIKNSPFPKKATDLLDESVIWASRQGEKILLPRHIAKIVSEKIKISVGEVALKEKEILLNLEKLIHNRIINQKEAVNDLAVALRRSRADIGGKKGPIGTFLFLGPSGVGKTETAKALTEIYFGGEERMIALDMSEFQTVEDIARLLGSPKEEGLLTTPVRENPFSLVLLDEIEKAHPNVLNLFLQVLEEGHLTDGLGRKVDFKNTIIVATSNAGSEIIRRDIQDDKKMDMIKDDLLDAIFKENIFRPEFVNRFDSVVVFAPLTKENLLDIADILLKKLKKNLAEKNIEFIITPELKQRVVDLSYNPVFGAREMKRIIQDKIENILAVAILREDLKADDKVEIQPKGKEEFELVKKR